MAEPGNCPRESFFLPLMGHSFMENPLGQFLKERGTFMPKYRVLTLKLVPLY